jgi:hypothetical protein
VTITGSAFTGATGLTFNAVTAAFTGDLPHPDHHHSWRQGDTWMRALAAGTVPIAVCAGSCTTEMSMALVPA